MLIATAIVLGGISLYFNKDWFRKDGIQIYHRMRPVPAKPGQKKLMPPAVPLTFGFDRAVKLTCVKVIPLSDLATNKYAHPIWHMISDSNSAPVKDFSYGGPIPGMRPNVKEATADSLESGVKYRLYIEAPAFKAEHDFDLEPAPNS